MLCIVPKHFNENSRIVQPLHLFLLQQLVAGGLGFRKRYFGMVKAFPREKIRGVFNGGLPPGPGPLSGQEASHIA